mmetsp:Transcript_12685/g.20583  ORF Transcript_12685/g.20583 Transcript_12685/m.20583 type:complete len:83 (+) Transcript_12685:154-402(+)
MHIALMSILYNGKLRPSNVGTLDDVAEYWTKLPGPWTCANQECVIHEDFSSWHVFSPYLFFLLCVRHSIDRSALDNIRQGSQ